MYEHRFQCIISPTSMGMCVCCTLSDLDRLDSRLDTCCSLQTEFLILTYGGQNRRAPDHVETGSALCQLWTIAWWPGSKRVGFYIASVRPSRRVKITFISRRQSNRMMSWPASPPTKETTFIEMVPRKYIYWIIFSFLFLLLYPSITTSPPARISHPILLPSHPTRCTCPKTKC